MQDAFREHVERELMRLWRTVLEKTTDLHFEWEELPQGQGLALAMCDGTGTVNVEVFGQLEQAMPIAKYVKCCLNRAIGEVDRYGMRAPACDRCRA